MLPPLLKTTLNGASRHRLRKGFLLLGEDWQLAQDKLVRQVKEEAQRLLNTQLPPGFEIETSSTNEPAILYLSTPFLSLYTLEQRNDMVRYLAEATSYLLSVAENQRCRLAAAGVNPYRSENDETPHALCADYHQIEIYDEGEIERIYNFYRHYLPELLAISAHSAVYGGVIQNCCSLRMQENPSSFLPRYITQFNDRHLNWLQGMMRREYGIQSLDQMDIDPLASPLQAGRSPVDRSASAMELRFIDAQCSYAFIRAQIIIFQAMAMRARSLARQGQRLYFLHDEVLDENKALAIQNGPSAIFKPDWQFKRREGKEQLTYHEKGKAEAATTSLLALLKRQLLPSLRELECEAWEILPIVLGAELRQDGLRCFGGYAEYQQYLCRTYGKDFAATLYEQSRQLLLTPRFDMLSYYNQDLYKEQSRTIVQRWEARLRPRQERSVERKHPVRPGASTNQRPQKRK